MADLTDLGAQGERTMLAWTRTGIALFINAMLALRSGARSDSLPLIIVAMILIAAAVLTTLYGAWRFRQLVTRKNFKALPTGLITSVTAVTLLACAGGIVSIVTDR